MASPPLSALLGVSAKPIRVTVLTTPGGGTFTPLIANSLCRVTLVGAGGGGGGAAGNNATGGGGGGGQTVIAWIRLTGAQTYWVGNRGKGFVATNGSSGENTGLGTLLAVGGSYGRDNNNSSMGGPGGGMHYSDDGGGDGYMTVAQFPADYIPGGAGGQGGTSNSYWGNGKTAGWPVQGYGSSTFPMGGRWAFSGVGASTYGGGGGASIYGAGGNGATAGGNNGSDATGYGSGGGGGKSSTSVSVRGGHGTDGLIIVEEWGA